MAVGTGAAADRSARPVRPPRSPKLAAQVARQIEADIAQAGWPVGEVFGGEEELRARYGVSRAVLREAIRLVEHHEVATMRRGRCGGLIVRAPDIGSLTAAVVIYLEYVGTSVEDLLAARLLLEPLAARLAAEHIPESGITRLRDTLREERAPGEDNLRARELLHFALSDLSGNTALHLFISVLIQLTTRYAQRPRLPGASGPALSAAADRAHTAIIDSIIAGNTARAEHQTTRHLEAMRDWLISTAQEPISRAPRTEPDTNGSTRKMAETVARRVIAEIAESGAGVGDVIGSEPELLERLDVSRAVFREAVRILEHHSVARTRRGPGGGLIVTEPDPTASIESMALYLGYQKIEVEQLRIVRAAIESGILALVVRRHRDPEVARRLRASLLVLPDTRREDVNDLAHELHTELAELSGSPILALFLRIITTLWQRRVQEPLSRPATGTEVATAVHDVHERIVEAILAGDLPVAQHRMQRHLTVLSSWW